ncbi:hypothetical protein [Zeaxanthinibacter enoshimensis]|uniref:Uncharacterized protein n=1 Tax=Zeaxanthinibacter enoshimensis TaxID=392009 RepID=A0A4R6TT30_9FLAO|nr:hypothetical protein [Zeaxanthinibacter enoshimensis]TDQ33363.1 hypothetical protein CLV82_1202 [Zeaxanthinibacter enoshimensis]
MQGQKIISTKFATRQVIVAALLFMMVGTGLELVLIDHYEDLLQLIPLVCIALAMVLVLVLLFYRTRFTIGFFKLVLGVSALSGLYGTFLHLQANYEFEQEMQPTADDWHLLVESLSGALPALAPGSMIVLALLGYSYITLINQKQQ